MHVTYPEQFNSHSAMLVNCLIIQMLVEYLPKKKTGRHSSDIMLNICYVNHFLVLYYFLGESFVVHM